MPAATLRWLGCSPPSGAGTGDEAWQPAGVAVPAPLGGRAWWGPTTASRRIGAHKVYITAINCRSHCMLRQRRFNSAGSTAPVQQRRFNSGRDMRVLAEEQLAPFVRELGHALLTQYVTTRSAQARQTPPICDCGDAMTVHRLTTWSHKTLFGDVQVPDHRLKIPGAWWRFDQVDNVLALRMP